MQSTKTQGLYEVCELCHVLQLSAGMTEIYIRNRNGAPYVARICRNCANPQLTYMAGHFSLNQVDVPRILGFAFGLTVAILNVAFGSLVGGQLGVWVALAGILAGAGITVAFAVSMALNPQLATP